MKDIFAVGGIVKRFVRSKERENACGVVDVSEFLASLESCLVKL